MNRYIINTLAFILAFFALVFTLATLSSAWIYKRGFDNWEAESNLLMMRKHHDYDMLLMGISHARNFSRYKNHLRLEKTLDREIINIGIGEGKCGSNEQFFYLKYFYSQHNTTKQVVYVLSTAMMNKGFLNEASNTFELEPFRIDFFYQYLRHNAENKSERLFYYIKSKFSRKWLMLKPRSSDRQDKALVAIDSTKIKEGLQLLLQGGERNDDFQRNCNAVEETIKLALANNSEIIFFISPALFGKWQGHYETLDFLRKMNEKYGIRYYDFSETVLIPKYYYDHHHLNSDGIDFFTEKYLKEILN